MTNQYKTNENIDLSIYPNSFLTLIKKLWLIPEKPHSLYVRGSFATQKHKHTPWDLDLYFFTNGDSIFENKVEVIANELSLEFNDLPKLDLTAIDRSAFLKSDAHILKRLLLVHGGVLVCGAPLKHELDNIILDSNTAMSVKRIMHNFVSAEMKKISLLLANNGNADDISWSAKKIAKMLIRAGVFIGIKNKAEFSRDIEYCKLNLMFEHPTLSNFILEMYSYLKTEPNDIVHFVNLARHLKSSIYFEGEFTVAP